MRLRNRLLLGTAATIGFVGLAGLYTAAVWPHNTDAIETPRMIDGLDIKPSKPFHNTRWSLDLYIKKIDFEESDASTIYEVDLDPTGLGNIDSRITGANIVLNRQEGRLKGDSSITASINYHIPTANMEMITQLTGSYRAYDLKTTNKSGDVERGIDYAAGEIRRLLDDSKSGLYRHLDDLDSRANGPLVVKE